MLSKVLSKMNGTRSMMHLATRRAMSTSRHGNMLVCTTVNEFRDLRKSLDTEKKLGCVLTMGVCRTWSHVLRTRIF